MSDFSTGFNSGYGLMNSVYDRRRQAEQDAIAAEERKFKLEERQRALDIRGKTDALADEIYQGSATFKDTASPFIDQYGLSKRESIANEYGNTDPLAGPYGNVNARSGAYAGRQGLALPEESKVPPALYGEPIKTPVTGSQNREFFRQNLRMAQLGGKPDDVMKAAAAQRDDDMKANSAAVYNMVLNAPVDALKKAAQGFTDMTHFPGKMTVDPKTGLATIKPDEGDPITMSREQTARFLTAVYKSKMGDDSGQADIAKIDEKLGKMSDTMFARLATTVEKNNSAVDKASDNEYRNRMLGLRAQEVNRSGAQANKPDFVQMTNDKGEAVFVDRRKIQTDASGVAVMPPGIRAPRMPQTMTDEQKISLTQYYRSLEANPPATPAMADKRKADFGVAGILGGPSGGQLAGGAPDWQVATGAGVSKPRPTTQQPAPDGSAPDATQPRNPVEYRQLQDALQRGLTPVGRGNSAFGGGELLFQDAQGNSVWASQLGQ